MIGWLLLIAGTLFAPTVGDGAPACTNCTVPDHLRAAGVPAQVVSSLEHMQVPDGFYADPLRVDRRRGGDSFTLRCGIEIWDWTCPGFSGDPPPGGGAPANPGAPPPGGAGPGAPAAVVPAGPSGRPACTPVVPTPPTPDLAAVRRWPQGEIVHEVGTGHVVTGMETEFTWTGPDQVSWTQAGRPGVRADCSLVAAPVVEFTARLQALVFDFGGERYVTGTGSVDHRYESDGAHRVDVSARWTLPGTAFVATVPAGSMRHRVVEIRSTLVD